jgi:hypothetical protein
MFQQGTRGVTTDRHRRHWWIDALPAARPHVCCECAPQYAARSHEKVSTCAHIVSRQHASARGLPPQCNTRNCPCIRDESALRNTPIPKVGVCTIVPPSHVEASGDAVGVVCWTHYVCMPPGARKHAHSNPECLACRHADMLLSRPMPMRLCCTGIHMQHTCDILHPVVKLWAQVAATSAPFVWAWPRICTTPPQHTNNS